MAYWALTRRHAYPARTIGALRDVWRSRPRPPSAFAPDVPPALDQLVLSLLSMAPLTRPASAAEVIERLEAIAGLEQREADGVAQAYLASPPLLGRSDEVLRLRKMQLRAGRGRGSVAWLSGEPGLGHTRLVNAAELEGKLAGAAVLATGDAGGRPWAVIRRLSLQLLDALPDIALSAARPFARELIPALPELAEHLGQDAAAVPDTGRDGAPGENGEEPDTADAFVSWLLGVAESTPLVIAVDDSARADLESMSVLAQVARQVERCRAMLVLAVPDGAVAAAPAGLDSIRRHSTRIALEAGDHAAAFGAIDELIAAGVLVSRDDTYELGFPAYARTAPDVAPEAMAREQYLRLAAVFERRDDAARKATNLLRAGKKEEAVDALLVAAEERKDYTDAGWRFGGREVLGDTTQAMRNHERILQEAEKLGRPPRELFLMRGSLIGQAYSFDPSLARAHVPPLFAQLRHDLGGDLWGELERDDEARAKRCQELAQARFDALPVAERVLAPRDAAAVGLGQVGFGMTLGRQGSDVELLERTVDLARLMTLQYPVLRALYLSAQNALDLVRGRDDVSRAMRVELHEYYDTLDAAGVELPVLSIIGRGVARTVDGHDGARFGGDRAARWADLMMERMYKDESLHRVGKHIWQHRAWAIRRLMHLYNGPSGEAQRCQREIDRLATRHTFSHYGGGAWRTSRHAPTR